VVIGVEMEVCCVVKGPIPGVWPHSINFFKVGIFVAPKYLLGFCDFLVLQTNIFELSV